MVIDQQNRFPTQGRGGLSGSVDNPLLLPMQNSLESRAVDWLRHQVEQSEWNPSQLGGALYQRLTGRELPPMGPVPALSHPGLDQILQRLLAGVHNGYPNREWLLWDLDQGRWQSKDFLAASYRPRTSLCEPAMVGGHAELGRLLEWVPGLTLVVGRPGIGKSRLLREAARHGLAQGYPIWRVECLERSPVSFQPFQDLAAELSRYPSRWREVEARLGEWLAPVLRLFPVLRGLSVCSPQEAPSPDFLSQVNLETSRALLRAMGPAIWVIDDLHLADRTVLECLLELDDPVLASSRQELPGVERSFDLQALSPEELGRLARSMCGPIVCSELTNWSQGHPLLAKALLRNLCENGALIRTPDSWERSSERPSWGDLTPSLEKILSDRCQRLRPATLQALRRGALLGRRFEVAELDLSDGQEALGEAVQTGLVDQDGPLTFYFTHDLIWKELRSFSTLAEKIDFHTRLAERLLASAQPSPSRLSDHLWESNQLAACLDWSLLAAREFRARWEMEGAAYYWERVTYLQPDHGQSWFELGCCLRYLGRFEAAQKALEQALTRAQDKLQRAECRARLGENAWRAGHLAQAEEHFGGGLAELGIRVPQGPQRGLAVLRELVAFPKGPIQLSEGQKLAARMLDQLTYTVVYSDGMGLIWANLRGLRLTARSNSLERGILLASHSILLLFFPPLLSRALPCIESALLLVAEDAHHLAATRARQGSILLFTGQLQAAVQASRCALESLERSGDRYDVRMARYNLAFEYYFLGRLELSQQLAQQGWQEARDAKDWLAAGYSARTLAVLGVIPEQFYQHYSEPFSHSVLEALRLEVLGLLELVRGRPQSAAEYLQQALNRSRRLKMSMDIAWQSGWLATAYRNSAELATLSQRPGLYREGLKAARESQRWAKAGYRIYFPHALREMAWCQLGLGLSTEHFEGSLKWAKQLEMPLQAELTRAAMSLAGLAEGGPTGDNFWQFQSASLRARDWARRFEEALQQAQRVLSGSTSPVVLVRAQEAAQALFQATSCRIQAGPTARPGQVQSGPVEPSGEAQSISISLGTHWGQPLCLVLQRQAGGNLLEEEVELASFLGSLVAVALENSAMLEERSALFEAVPVGLASLDPQGAILQANSTLKKMLGSQLEGHRLEEYQCRERGLEGGYWGQRGQLLLVDERRAEWGPGRSVVSLTDVSWRRLQQVAQFQEQERSLLGIEIHDVSQPLVGLAYQLSALELGEGAQQVRQVLEQLRSLMLEYRSPGQGPFDLAESAGELVSEVCAHGRISCQLELSEEVSQVQGLVAIFAYRILGEGLANVRRHSQATVVGLRLTCRFRQLIGSLYNDGAPRESSSSTFGLGLQGIAARAQLVGGWARFRRLPGGGGILHFRLPLLGKEIQE